MRRIGFRSRLFVILLLLAVIPLAVLTLVFGGTLRSGMPLLRAGNAAWEGVAETGRATLEIARRSPLTPAERAVVDSHEVGLQRSLTNSRRWGVIASRVPALMGVLALVLLLLIGVIVARIAGHLSRQLSRPLRELVGWTERIAKGESLPDGPPRRGAPEFEMLRLRMRRMARELATARVREVEAARLRAFRESARQVAHELKNPLTPIRFALDRLKRDVPPHLAESVAVIASETERLETMARDFAQFGRLPDGPVAEVDMAELVRATARATIPDRIPVYVDIANGLPMVRGHHDALTRALSNVLINAVHACGDENSSATVRIAVSPVLLREKPAVRISVRDTGCGIAPDRLAGMWEPYVTYKAGGTGLGLAIARQTVLAHQGEVGATSALGEGTEIHFTLPVDSQAVIADAQPAELEETTA